MDKYQRKNNKTKSWLFEKVIKINKPHLDWPLMVGGGGMKKEKEDNTIEASYFKRINRE